jgi:hypothetical protein
VQRTTTPPPGGLGIRTARTWATWQLVAACTATWVAGMMLGYSGQKPSAGSGAARPIVALGGLTSEAPTTAPAPAAPATTSSTPDPASTATTGTAPAGARSTVLMANTPGQGPSDLPVFTAGGPWSIGWHFRCVNAPGGTAAFSLRVVPDPGGAPTPAVEQTSREAQGITPETAPGRQHLKVITDPACQWAVKVTGVAP